MFMIGYGSRIGRLGLRWLCLGATVLMLGHPRVACKLGKAPKDGDVTAEKARAALIRMADSLQPDPEAERELKELHGEDFEIDIEDDPRKLALPVLKRAKATVIDKSHVAFGAWSCDLDKRTWALEIELVDSYQRFEGVFYRGPTGRWEAKTTGVMSAD